MATEAFEALSAVLNQSLEDTILAGWPEGDLPTEDEAYAIESTYRELSIRSVGWSTINRWRLAGQLVARESRDRLQRIADEENVESADG